MRLRGTRWRSRRWWRQLHTLRAWCLHIRWRRRRKETAPSLLLGDMALTWLVSSWRDRCPSAISFLLLRLLRLHICKCVRTRAWTGRVG